MIIGVAIRGENIMVKLPKPARHKDCFFYLDGIGVDPVKSNIGMEDKDQGFYTDADKYLDRVQAAEYVKTIEQPLIDGSISRYLSSGDLW